MRNFPLSLFTIVDENLDGADVANNPQVDGVALDWGGAVARGPRGLGGAAAQEDRAGQRIVADGGKRRSGERREAKFNSLRKGGGEGDLQLGVEPQVTGHRKLPGPAGFLRLDGVGEIAHPRKQRDATAWGERLTGVEIVAQIGLAVGLFHLKFGAGAPISHNVAHVVAVATGVAAPVGLVSRRRHRAVPRARAPLCGGARHEHLAVDDGARPGARECGRRKRERHREPAIDAHLVPRLTREFIARHLRRLHPPGKGGFGGQFFLRHLSPVSYTHLTLPTNREV